MTDEADPMDALVALARTDIEGMDYDDLMVFTTGAADVAIRARDALSLRQDHLAEDALDRWRTIAEIPVSDLLRSEFTDDDITTELRCESTDPDKQGLPRQCIREAGHDGPHEGIDGPPPVVGEGGTDGGGWPTVTWVNDKFYGEG